MQDLSGPIWYTTVFLYLLLVGPEKGHHPSLFPFGEDWTLHWPVCNCSSLLSVGLYRLPRLYPAYIYALFPIVINFALKMEAAWSFETLPSYCAAAQCHDREGHDMNMWTDGAFCFVCCCSTQRVVEVGPCNRAHSQCSSHHGSLLVHLFHKESHGLLLHQGEFSHLQHYSRLLTQSLFEGSKRALACSSRVHLHRYSLTTVCVLIFSTGIKSLYVAHWTGRICWVCFIVLF
jgi:hypothetical protein